MKKTLFFLTSFLIVLAAFSQPVTTTIPDKSYGSGGTKTVTTTKNEQGGETTVTEIKDRDGKVRDRNHTIKDAGGAITVNDTNFTKGGNVFKTVHQEFNNKQMLLNSQSKEYAGGNVTYSVDRKIKVDGSYDVHIEDKEKGKTYDNIDPKGATYIQPPNDFKHPEQNKDCSKRFELMAGYSYLSSKVGDEKKGYPYGPIVLLGYSLSEDEKWDVQVEGSLHYEKDNDFTFKQSYLLGGLKYDFKEKEKCKSELKWDGYVRILLGGGFFSESYETMGYSNKFKDCGPAGGLGGGLNLRISDSFRVGVGVDYIGTKFDDDYVGGIRGSAGLYWDFDFRKF